MKMNNKRAELGTVLGSIMLFSFLSMIGVFLAVLFYGVTNDYILFNLQDIAENMENQSVLSNDTVAFLQDTGDSYRTFNFYWDDIWFLSYVVFFIVTLITSYKVRRQNYFSFLGMLFYGVMAILFALSLFETLTDWFKNNILIPMLPSVTILLPKFYYYVDNVGVFSAIQIGLCILINMTDFDFAKIFQKRKQEEQAINDQEML